MLFFKKMKANLNYSVFFFSHVVAQRSIDESKLIICACNNAVICNQLCQLNLQSTQALLHLVHRRMVTQVFFSYTRCVSTRHSEQEDTDNMIQRFRDKDVVVRAIALLFQIGSCVE